MTPLSLIYGAIFVLGVPANLFVVLIILRVLRIRSVTNVFMLNLALADLLFLSWIPLVIARSESGQWLWGMSACKLYFIGSTVNQFGSVAFLTALSLDRYLAICHPIVSKWFRKVHIAALESCVCWLIVIAIMTPIYIYSTVAEIITTPDAEDVDIDSSDADVNIPASTISKLSVNIHDSNWSSIASGVERQASIDQQAEVQCLLLWPSDSIRESRTVFTLYMGILGYVIPMVLIWSMYGCVLATIRKRPRRQSDHRSLEALRRMSRRNYRKATLMVMSVVLSYTICWAPFWLLQLVIETAADDDLEWVQTSFFQAAYCLQAANSMLNPFLYCFLSGSYVALFRRCCTNAARSVVDRLNQSDASLGSILRSRSTSAHSRQLRNNSTIATFVTEATIMLSCQPGDVIL